MEDIISDINDFCKSLVAKCKEYDANRRDVEDKYKELSYAYGLCTKQIEYMGKQNEEFMSTISRLQKQIETIEDDKRQLTKVSNIIAIERENSRLKFELEYLKKRLAKTTEKVPVGTVAAETCAPTIVETDIDNVKTGVEETVVESKEHAVEETVVEAEDDIEVYEKKIKNIVYYVSTKDDMSVYEKDSDGSIGNKIGYLQKVNGKLKLQLLEC